MESKINTNINLLEISNRINSHIEKIFCYFSSDESLENNLVNISSKINALKKIFEKYSLKNLLEELKGTCNTDIILILKAVGNLNIKDELNKKINNEYSLNIALILAVRNGNKKNVELLLDNKVNLETLDNNILIINAIRSGNKEVLKIILETLKKSH